MADVREVYIEELELAKDYQSEKRKVLAETVNNRSALAIIAINEAISE